MNLHIISVLLTLLLVISNILFIKHLYRRIESQSNQLKDIQTYTSIISIDELKKLDEYRRETLIARIEIETRKIAEEETAKHFKEMDKEIDEKIKITTDKGAHEFVSFCLISLSTYSKENRTHIIDLAFPHNKQMIINYFNSLEK